MKFTTKNEHLKPLFYDVLGAIVSGIILSFMFFIFSDFISTIPNLNGKWQVEMVTEKTSYSKYKDLKLYYDVILFQKGYEIEGSGEKIMEKQVGQDTLKYTGSKRVRIKVHGYLDKNYLSKDKLIIYYTEEGRKRETSSFHDLTHFDEDLMSGSFISTIANSSGSTRWSRSIGK